MTQSLQSALYFLVWHIGMRLEEAHVRYFNADPVIRKYWAVRGHVDGKPCFDALAEFADREHHRQLTQSILRILEAR